MDNPLNDHLDCSEGVGAVPAISSGPQTTVTASAVANNAATAILNPFDPRLPLPDSQHDPLYLVAPQTWAQSNPGLGVQTQRPRAKATAAAKATKKITAECNRAAAKLLSDDISNLAILRQTQIEKIAQDHSRKVSDIEKLVNNHTHYRETRGPSLSNALTHKKGVEMNEGVSFVCLNIVYSYIFPQAGKLATEQPLPKYKRPRTMTCSIVKSQRKRVNSPLMSSSHIVRGRSHMPA